jgi:hypothetical protein
MRWAVGAAAFLSLCEARAADPGGPLGDAKASFRRLDYEKCADRAKRAARLPADAGELAEAALYEGICDFYLGLPSAAQTAFERALTANPRLILPAFSSPKLVRFFDEIARTHPAPTTEPTEPPVPRAEASHPPSLDATGPASPPAPNPEPAPPEVARAEASAVAATPSAPQTVSGSAPRAPWRWEPVALGGGALAALGGGAAFGLVANHDESVANAAPFQSDVYRYGHAARNAALGANVCFAVAATAAVSAAVAWLLER